MPKYLKKEPNSTESQPIQVLEIINYFLLHCL